MASGSQLFRKLRLMIVSTVIGLLLLEAGARVYLVHFAPPERFKEWASWSQLQDHPEKGGADEIISPHRYVSYIPTPGYVSGKNHHDARGFRGDGVAVPKPPGTFRIACLGGSTTYTTKVEDPAQSYPALLGKALRLAGHDSVETINAGAPGYSSWETLASFEYRVLDLEPDLVVIYQSVNDIKPRFVWPPEAYRGDNSGARSPPPPTFMPGLLEYSTALRIFMISTGRWLPQADFERVVYAGPDTYYGSAYRAQIDAGSYPQGLFQQVDAKTMLETNGPVYFRRNIGDIIAICKARGIGVVLATFAWCPANDKVFASPAFDWALRQMNVTIRELAAETGVHLFDFAPLFGQDPSLYADGCHVNVQGALRKAKLFSDDLQAAGLVP